MRRIPLLMGLMLKFWEKFRLWYAAIEHEEEKGLRDTAVPLGFPG